MTIRYFKKIKSRVTKLKWLTECVNIDTEYTECVNIDTEYDEDADAGIISGSIFFKDGPTFHFKKVLLGEKRHYRFHYMDEQNNLKPIIDYDSRYRKDSEHLNGMLPCR